MSVVPKNYKMMSWQERKALREEYIADQGGLCRYCGGDLKKPPAPRVQALSVKTSLFPKDFFKWPVHLHHNHQTGMTIGAVHARCNAVLWQYHGE